jgi:8-oxo-dGTP diphosphatase
MDESLEAAAVRVLGTKTGLTQAFLEQLYTFGKPDRDPRTRIISVTYYALVDPHRFKQLTVPHEDATVARIVPSKAASSPLNVTLKSTANKVLELAFDHQEILAMAVQRLRGKIDYTAVGFELLPPSFTLFQLQKVHETVLGRTLNKDSFRRRMLASGQLEPTGEIQQDVDHRPASLYRFVPSR